MTTRIPTKYEELISSIDEMVEQERSDAADGAAQAVYDSAYETLVGLLGDLVTERDDPDVADVDKASSEFLDGVRWAVEQLVERFGVSDEVTEAIPYPWPTEAAEG